MWVRILRYSAGRVTAGRPIEWDRKTMGNRVEQLKREASNMSDVEIKKEETVNRTMLVVHFNEDTFIKINKRSGIGWAHTSDMGLRLTGQETFEYVPPEGDTPEHIVIKKESRELHLKLGDNILN